MVSVLPATTGASTHCSAATASKVLQCCFSSAPATASAHSAEGRSLSTVCASWLCVDALALSFAVTSSSRSDACACSRWAAPLTEFEHARRSNGFSLSILSMVVKHALAEHEGAQE